MEDGHYAIFGDATEDSVFERVGEINAMALAIVLGSDAENLYVVLSARMLNADMCRSFQEHPKSQLQLNETEQSNSGLSVLSKQESC